jgi:hypothetical protein
VPTIPFYVFYSMFGFQRVGDQIWQVGDARGRGFLIGATAAALMGVAVTWLGAGMSDALIGRQAGLREFALLTGLCAAGLGVYAAAAWAFGALRTGLAIHGIRKSAP